MQSNVKINLVYDLRARLFLGPRLYNGGWFRYTKNILLIYHKERWDMVKKTTLITVQNVPVTVMHVDQSDYISLTDMAKARTDAARAADVIKNWLRARSTLEFLGTWEIMYNQDFKVVEFDHFKSEAGLHTFTLSAKEWIERTNAIGIYVQAGRYGGTYAHKDIAFEFGSASRPVFKLYLLKE